MNPLISVIIPVYNAEEYINECLDSVCSQTYSNLEIICVDDCGTDKSSEILCEYHAKDSRIKIISHPANYGLSVSRNTGLNNCTGKYFFFLDADDYISSSAIEASYSTAKKTNADIVIGNVETFLDNGIDEENIKNVEFNKNKLDKSFTKYSTFSKYLQVTERNYVTFLYGLMCVSWGRLYSTRFFRENNIQFIKSNQKYEDYGFQLKYLAVEPRVSIIKDCLYFYRLRKNSIMSFNTANSKWKRFCNTRVVAKDALKYIKLKNDINIVIKTEFIKYYKLKYHIPTIIFRSLFRFRWSKNSKYLRLLGFWIIKP